MFKTALQIHLMLAADMRALPDFDELEQKT
jgi:hypothetical protein